MMKRSFHVFYAPWQHDSLTDHELQVDETAPSNFPLWARWLCLLTFWPGVIWYLYYKLLVEDELRVQLMA